MCGKGAGIQFNMNCLIILSLLAWCASDTTALYHTRSINMEAFAPDASSYMSTSSLFGFSLAFQANERGKSIIISAPTADKIGKVFSCPVSGIGKTNCEEFSIVEDKDITAIRKQTLRKIETVDSNAWLGATVAATSSYFIACAPRVVTANPSAPTQLSSFGRCYVNHAANSDLYGSRTMQDLPTMSIGDRGFGVRLAEHHETSYGWSSAVNQNMAIVGGAATNKSGVLIYDNIVNSASRPVPIYSNSHFKGNVILNLGYSVAIGNFFDETQSVYAFSSPYGFDGIGTIVFFRKNQTAVYYESITESNQNYFEHEKYCDLNDPTASLGSMYAAALCTANLDGDGRADLVVGAPTFTSEDPNLYEIGAFHVFYGMGACSASTKVKPVWTIKGKERGGRLGMAIANIGDMDDDRIDDIVIAAPYENNGNGVIYLYSGAEFRGSTEPRYSQKIHPKPSPGAPGSCKFGFSLAPLQDYNAEGSSGLAVGGLCNKAVAFLYQVPYFRVDIYAIVPDLKNLTDFEMQACFNFTYPSKPRQLSADIDMRVEIKHEYARLATNESFFQRNFTINNEIKSTCQTVQVVLPPEGNYVTSAIEYVIKALQTGVKDPLEQDEVSPVKARLLDGPSNKFQRVIWQQDCEQETCKPDLALKIDSNMTVPYLVGSTASEAIVLSVTNSGDPAYKHCVKLRARNASLHNAACSHDKDGWIVCAPRRPLNKGDTWVIRDLKINTNRLTSADKEVTFAAIVYNKCSDAAAGNMTVEFERELVYDSSNVALAGANEADLKIIKLNETELSKGRRFTHIYTVLNEGVTTWSSVQCLVELVSRPYWSYEDIKISGANFQDVCAIDDKFSKVNGTFNMTCNLGTLAPRQRTDIYISIVVKNVDKVTLEKNVTVTSNLTLDINGAHQSVETLLVPVITRLQTWIIVLSCLAGFLLLVAIAFGLYKCGFLKRRKKKELKDFKRESIRRQSMRQSVYDNASVNRVSVVSTRNSMNDSQAEGVTSKPQGNDENSGSTTQVEKAEVHI